ncbi:hypothetical protein GCM10020219_064620 [Nonomuraea dietziae]
MVCRLVQKESFCPTEENSRQFHPSALTAGERFQRLLEHAVGQAEAGGDRGRLGLGRVAAEDVHLVLEPAVALDRLVAHLRVVARHAELGLVELAQHLVEAAGRQDAVAREHLQVALAGVLGEVADAARGGDRSGGGHPLTGQDLGEGRLARAVAADQADLVSWVDPERRVLDEQARARAQLDVTGDDHVGKDTPGIGMTVMAAWGPVSRECAWGSVYGQGHASSSA